MEIKGQHLAVASYRSHTADDNDPQGMLYLATRYMEHLRVRNYSEQTIYGKVKTLRYFRVFCEQIGITQARQVTRAVVLNYQSYLYHYRKLSSGTALTVSTQKHWLGGVSEFFSWMTRDGHILFNPASDLEMPRREFRLPKNIFTAAEVEAVLNVADVGDPVGIRNRAITEMLYSSGLRRQELCNLNMGDLDFDRGLVRVDQGKGKKDRFVPVGERAVKWVEKYLADVRPRLCPSINEAALFLNNEGRRMSGNVLGRVVSEMIGKAQIGKRGSCHLFRHTFATLLLEAGCDVRYVQEMLGHVSIETTAIYTHVAVRALKDAHTRFHPARLPDAVQSL